MTTVDLADRLTHEHHDIDDGIEEFTRALDGGTVDPEPLRRAFDALRRHIYLEEELLFPPIRRAGLMMPVLVMTKEHGELWQLMDGIERQLEGPASDKATIRASCEGLLGALDGHNTKEEPIVYPHSATDLTADEEATLADFIETGTMPDGWVCAAIR